MVSWPPQQCLVPSVLRHGEHSPGRLCLWPSAPKEDAMDQHGMSICPNLEPLSCPINARSLLQLHLPPRQVSSKPSHLGWESHLATKRGSRSCNGCDFLWHAVHRMTLTYLPSKQWWITPWNGENPKHVHFQKIIFEMGSMSVLKRGHHPKKNIPLSLGAWPCDGAPPPPGSGAGRPGHENGSGNSGLGEQVCWRSACFLFLSSTFSHCAWLILVVSYPHLCRWSWATNSSLKPLATFW